MYDELIKNLRDYAEVYKLTDNENTLEYPLLIKAADVIEKLSKPKWIPVTERLPEEEQTVLVVRIFLGVKGQVPPSVYVEIAERIGDDWCADSDEYKIARSRHTNPTHWMPLPEPPEEET